MTAPLIIPTDAHSTGGEECAHWVHPAVPRCSPDCDYGADPVRYWWVPRHRYVPHHGHEWTGDLVPPADLVALTEPCDTLQALSARIGPGLETSNHDDCPDCHDGKQLVEARQTPPTPAGVDPSEPRNDLPGWDDWDPNDGPFTVSLGVGTLELLPYFDIGDRIAVPWMHHVGPGSGDEMWAWLGPNVEAGENLSTGRMIWKFERLPFAVEPGQFVACFTTTETP